MNDAYGLRLTQTNKRALVLRAVVPMVATDAPRSWIHIAYEGKWEGHSEGPFELDSAKFASMVKAFNAQKNPLPVDYEHASVRTDGRNGIPAAGWIHRLELRNDGLWAEVEWTERASSMIRAGEYRFCSGVFVFGDRDRKTAEEIPAELFNCALTNTPFIDGQTPITLSRKVALSMDAGQIIAQLAKLLGLDASAGAADIVAAVEGLTKIRDAQDGKGESDAEEKAEPKAPEASEVAAAMPPPGAPVEPQMPAPAAQDPGSVAAGEEALALLREALSLEATADAAMVLATLREKLDAIKSAVGGVAAGAPPSVAAARTAPSQAVVYEAAIRNLEAKLSTYVAREAEAKKSTAHSRVDALVAAGKVLDAERSAFVEMAESTPDAFERIASKLLPRVPLGEVAAAPKPDTATNLALSESDEGKVKFLVRSGLTRSEAERRVASAMEFINSRRGA